MQISTSLKETSEKNDLFIRKHEIIAAFKDNYLCEPGLRTCYSELCNIF